MLPEPKGQRGERQDRRANDRQRGQIGGVTSAWPIRRPQRRMRTNEASGRSQASPRSFGRSMLSS